MAESSTGQVLTVAPISRASTNIDDSWGNRLDDFGNRDANGNVDPKITQTSQTRESDRDDRRKSERHETADVSELVDAFGNHFWSFDDNFTQDDNGNELADA